MAVAFDAACTTSISDDFGGHFPAQTFITVGSGANRALVVLLQFVGATLPGSIVATWDVAGTPQTMTQIANTFATNGTNCSVLYGLVAPHAGLLQFQMSYTPATTECGVFAVSFTGANQTGGATTFGGNNNSGTGTNPATVTITATSSDAICACMVDDNTQASGTFSDTQIDGYRLGNAEDGGANYAVGTGTHALTCTWGGTCNWAASGTSIKAVSAGDILMPMICM